MSDEYRGDSLTERDAYGWDDRDGPECPICESDKISESILHHSGKVREFFCGECGHTWTVKREAA